MRFREIFRFELAYQLRRPWPWLAFAVLLVFAFENTRSGILPVTLPEDFILNSPFIIASVSTFSCLIWLLVASPLAGEAAARDMQTGTHPLVYTQPVGKAEYLGGRFLAAVVLNALVLLGVQVGSLLAVYAGGVDPAIIGPFRPMAYLAAYTFIALPNAYIAATFQFAAGLLSGRSMASYAGSVLLGFFSLPVPMFVYLSLGDMELAKALDPIGLISIMNEMMTEWTIVEKNVRMFSLDGSMLVNRLLWLGIATATNLVVYARFRFAHPETGAMWTRVLRRFARTARPAAIEPPEPAAPARAPGAFAVPSVRQSFGFATHLRQTIAIGRSSFWMIVKSIPGYVLFLVYPAFLLLAVLVELEHWGVPMVIRTGYVLLKDLTAPITQASDYRVLLPLLIVYFAGELVWRERDARLHENVDATAAPDWVLLLGKFLGLALILAAHLAVVMAVSVTAQTVRGNHDYEIGLYLTILFGLQLPEYLIFAALAIMVQVVVNQKYVALLATLTAYFLIVFSPLLGIQHNLIIYGASPAWSYTDIRGFGDSIGPWMWFKLYWAAWALLLGAAGRLFLMRGLDASFAARVAIARRRLTRATAGAFALAAGLIVTLGGFVYYNTNVLNEYISDGEMVRRRAEYERRYGAYEGIPQPTRTATTLHIEIHPARRTAEISGTYRLRNGSQVPIDSIHLEPAPNRATRVSFDRPARVVVTDEELGHHIYALEEPLEPGDSMSMAFTVELKPNGFRNSGRSTPVVENGTHFTSGALPLIGYQPLRELWSADDRREHGLPRQVTLPPPGDIDPSAVAGGAGVFEAIIGTDADQVAVAPGELRGTWLKDGRRYFQYASDVPLVGTEFFFSADYAVHREEWKGIDVQIYLHPSHAKHRERLLRSVRASLDYNSAHFRPYPHRFLQVVEQPGNFLGMGVDGSGLITGGEGMFLLDPKGDGFDVIFEVAAHEMGHQWWGMQLVPAFAEGGGIISESLAWYSAMRLVRQEKGPEALRRFMSLMRQPTPWPPIRTGRPLLRAMDPWANYRKGPYVMHALAEYAGEDRVNAALARLLEKKAGAESSQATSLDLYRELQAVTPDSLQSLLHELFETNTYWSFDTKNASSVQTDSGAWRVTFEIEARKTLVDSAGRESDVPMDEWVELGVFAAAGEGEILGKPIYVQKHRIRSGTQTITVMVRENPARGGIDPYNLLDWEEGDNIEEIVAGDAE